MTAMHGARRLVRAIRDRFDLVNGLWTRTIIRFDALRQRGMLTSFGIADPNPGDLLLVLSAILAAVLAIATLWALRDLGRPRGDALDRAWSRLGRRLAREGVAREPSEGTARLAHASTCRGAGIGERARRSRAGLRRPALRRARARRRTRARVFARGA